MKTRSINTTGISILCILFLLIILLPVLDKVFDHIARQIVGVL